MEVKASVLVTAITGVFFGNMAEFHEYVEKLLDRPVWTHELANKEVWNEIKEKSRKDVEALNEALQSIIVKVKG